jgi:CheY-like chemotaxis protein
MKGQIVVASEVAKGTIYTIDLLFEYGSLNGARKGPRKIRSLFFAPQGPPRDSLPSLPTSPMKSPVSPRPPKPNLTEEKGQVITPDDAEFPHRGSHHSDKTVSASLRTNDHTLNTYSTRSDTPSQHFNMSSSVHDSPAHLEILIADSDIDSMRILDEKLSERGHTVDFAHDGQEGHDRFASNPGKFDVILMELKVYGVIVRRMIE